MDVGQKMARLHRITEYLLNQWCFLVFVSAEAMGLIRGEGAGAGGAEEPPPARGKLSKTGSKTGPSGAF